MDFDCIIVGGGIVGLAHARAAHSLGMRVAVVEREARCIGASIRNFGFITVTGQQQGITWRRAMRSRDIWAEIAPLAGIAIEQTGLVVAARRPEAMAVLAEFAACDMGQGCHLLSPTQMPPPCAGQLLGGLFSPHEIRVESREAIPRLTAYLAGQGVSFITGTAVNTVGAGRVETNDGPLYAPRIVVCPGADITTLFPHIFRRRETILCKLHMLRLASPGMALPNPIMSDLGLIRYLGYQTKSLPALRARLEQEQPAHLADGIHLIVVQSADGSLIVGDSHHYHHSPDPFQPRAVDDRILEEYNAVLNLPPPEVIERWVGVYPSGPDTAFTEAVDDGVRLVSVTSGTGASTGFALAEETMAELAGLSPPAHVQGI